MRRDGDGARGASVHHPMPWSTSRLIILKVTLPVQAGNPCIFPYTLSGSTSAWYFQASPLRPKISCMSQPLSVSFRGNEGEEYSYSHPLTNLDLKYSLFLRRLQVSCSQKEGLLLRADTPTVKHRSHQEGRKECWGSSGRQRRQARPAPSFTAASLPRSPWARGL